MPDAPHEPHADAERTTGAVREQQWRRLALDADSMLSLIRHRGGITWGGPLPESYEVDAVIGALRVAYERGQLPEREQTHD